MMNKCYSYLLPLFNEECPIDNDYYIMLDNVYTRYNDLSNVFVLCYIDNDNKNFLNYIGRLHNHELFKESFKASDLIYLVFDFPERFKYEYNCYLNGQFSKFRDEAKNVIINYILSIHKIDSATSVRRVLYKDPELKQRLETQLNLRIDESSELSSIPDIETETCYNF